ncbi:MAG: hypothetical protein H0W09_03985 [Solirubrobacterales bacterium]|nr:hypothetical protein [Solirubrobacterales bacterium]
MEGHYRNSGWRVTRSADGVLEAAGPSGVTWFGRAVTAEDLATEAFEAEVVDLADRRMGEVGELCPLDLLPSPECEGELRALLGRVGLDRRPHVSVYSLAA